MRITLRDVVYVVLAPQLAVRLLSRAGYVTTLITCLVITGIPARIRGVVHYSWVGMKVRMKVKTQQSNNGKDEQMHSNQHQGCQYMAE
jgi:hypothetical protein